MTTSPRPDRTAAPAEAPREAEAPKSVLEPLYHLVLLDDDHHTYAYVIEMLGNVFGYAHEKAFVLARMVDVESRVVVETAAHERVTRDQRKIHAYGPDPRIAASVGSMSAVVEPAEAR